jgi:hypothetical protein
VVVLIRVVLLVCEIMQKDSDGTSENKELFGGARVIVYNDRLFGVRRFSFLRCLLVLLCRKASYNFETVSTPLLFWCSQNESLVHWLRIPISHSCYQSHLHMNQPLTVSSLIHGQIQSSRTCKILHILF